MKLNKAFVRRKPFTAFPDGGHVSFILIKLKQRLAFQNNNFVTQ